MPVRALWVIAYDIRDDRRRFRVDRALTNVGTRVQYSVFEAHLSHAELQNLKLELGRCIDNDNDSVRYYPQCARCSLTLWADGWVMRDEAADYYVF